MADLTTTYMGLALENPIIAGASILTQNMDSIRKIEDAGAGALVIASLFEEQIQLDHLKMSEEIVQYDDWHAEMSSIFPQLEHSGPEEHLMWVRRTKEAVDIPVIASLNAVEKGTWVEWAKRLADTGVDGLELNFFALPKDFDATAADIESAQVDALREVKKSVKIPVSVKLSPYYTSPLNFIKRLDEIGVNGFVLFNRYFQPKSDVVNERNDLSFNLSSENDHRIALRFAGILHGQVKASICANNGIHTATNAIELLLAGADVVQVVSTLFRNSIGYIGTMVSEIDDWMEHKEYKTIADFKGKMSKGKNPDDWAYTRGQYVMTLLKAKEYLRK
jgi:dihydroorotate dehydrogenase (fumarate)